jgi:hypothetical protein
MVSTIVQMILSRLLQSSVATAKLLLRPVPHPAVAKVRNTAVHNAVGFIFINWVKKYPNDFCDRFY